MRQLVYKLAGLTALGLGTVGAFLPLLPTVPFLILAAFFFSRGSPALEARLLMHPGVGPHIRAWRERRAISRKGKVAAAMAFIASALLGLVFLDWPLWAIPVIAAIVGGSFVLTRPEA